MTLCTEVVVLRFLPDEYRMICDLAAARGISENDLIRDCLGTVSEADARPVERERRLALVP